MREWSLERFLLDFPAYVLIFLPDCRLAANFLTMLRAVRREQRVSPSENSQNDCGLQVAGPVQILRMGEHCCALAQNLGYELPPDFRLKNRAKPQPFGGQKQPFLLKKCPPLP
jgi:hypothetical protein